MYSATENKSDDIKGALYEESEGVRDQFSKYYIEILIENCTA
jgi:hypothetical protein